MDFEGHAGAQDWPGIDMRDPREPFLTSEERHAIDAGRWFSALSPTLRHDILRRAHVRRYRDGQAIASRGDRPRAWAACAGGAVRIGSINANGRVHTLTYVEPGVWFGDSALIDGEGHSHDTWAKGDTTLVCVAEAAFRELLNDHAELGLALLVLQVRRLRRLFTAVEDASTQPIRVRLGRQLLALARAHGVPEGQQARVRIGLDLLQEEIGLLIGASRQRVNQALKAMERASLIEISAQGIVINDSGALKIELDRAEMAERGAMMPRAPSAHPPTQAARPR